jgi:hypothetical protein
LPNDWIEDVADLLETNGIGTKGDTSGADWGIFGELRPSSTQAKVIQLSRTGGIPFQPFIQGLRRYTFQVMVVAEKDDFESGQQKAEEIYSLLAGNVGLVSNRTFDYFTAIQHPEWLGFDENANFMIGNNYETQIRE